jgi:cob(I)alamin adenosyltransferase
MTQYTRTGDSGETSLSDGQRVSTPAPVILRTVNRLSDLLCVRARTVNHRRQTPEIDW